MSSLKGGRKQGVGQLVSLGYFLGCPMWGNAQWAGAFFTQQAEASDYLAQYSSVFNAVEGNTTFYGLPQEALVARWREQAQPGFQFAFKLPQRVTHGLRLDNAQDELRKFFLRISPLESLLGPMMVQLPADFGPERLAVLQRFLRQLPQDFNYVVEVRNPAFYKDRDCEQRLNEMLVSQQVDRVMFDSRPLFSARPTTDAVKDAQRKKPQLPANTYELGQYPVLRFIGHPQQENSRQYFRPWQRKVARWVQEGRKPFVFLHTPDNVEAPQLAAAFHEGMQEFLSDWQPLPAFPVMRRQRSRVLAKRVAAGPIVREAFDEEQLDLF